MAETNTRDIADKLVAHCRNNTTLQGVDELYADDAQSVEAAPSPGFDDPVTRGKDGIKGKQQWWAENFIVHSANVDGPYMHGDDRFAVIFEMNAEEKASNTRWDMKEVGIYTVSGGKIAREEFFYTMDG